MALIACSRLHNKPTFSQSIVLQNSFRNPQNSAISAEAASLLSDVELQQHYDDFFEDIFLAMEDKYGGGGGDERLRQFGRSPGR